MKSVIIGIIVMILALVVVDFCMDDSTPKSNAPSAVQPTDPSFSNFKIN